MIAVFFLHGPEMRETIRNMAHSRSTVSVFNEINAPSQQSYKEDYGPLAYDVGPEGTNMKKSKQKVAQTVVFANSIQHLALKAKEKNEEKVILFNFSGHGLLDLKAYEDGLAGVLQDYEPEQAVIRSARYSFWSDLDKRLRAPE